MREPGAGRRASVAATLLALLAGCGGGDAAAGSAAEDPPPTADCAAVNHPPLQGGSHLLDGQEPPVAYSSTPGTSGWHASGPAPEGVAERPLSEPELVLALEAGRVVVAYDPAQVGDDDLATLAALVAADDGRRLTVTAFAGDMGAPVVLNGWGVRQACDRVDAEAVRAFVEAFAGRGPGADS